VIDRFLFGPGTRRRLAVTQMGLAFLVGLRVALGPYAGLAGQPASLFRPVWFLEALPAMPPVAVMVALQVLGVAGAALALVDRGRRRQVAFVVAWLCLLVLAGLRTSRGKVLHNDVLVLLACVPFLASPPPEGPVRYALADRRLSLRHGWPVHAALVVVAGAYFLCGWAKVAQSGLAWVTTDNVRNVLLVAAGSGRLALPAVAEAVASEDWLCHLVAALVLALELSFPVVLVAARARVVYAASAATFHAATWLLLGIDYWAWAGVAVLVLVDWDRVGLRRRERRPSPEPVGDADLVAVHHL
jgi:hypothetical protein